MSLETEWMHQQNKVVWDDALICGLTTNNGEEGDKENRKGGEGIGTYMFQGHYNYVGREGRRK